MAEIQPASPDRFVVCACREKEYTASDTVDAALFRGDLESIWQNFLGSVGAEKRARELELELDEDAMQQMAEHFRYEHDLITAEETECWLEQRGLTLEDFTDYFARQHWRDAVGEGLIEHVDFELAPRELRELFVTELILKGDLDRLAKELMWRLAAMAVAEETNLDAQKIAAERQQFAERLRAKPLQIQEWLDRIGRDEQWLTSIITMETAFRQIRETILTPERRKKQLALLRMPLTHFEAEVVELESADAAKEALLCIRQDGLSMEEVALDARYPYRRITFRHEDVPAELQQKFWSVAAGDLLDPVRRGDGFELYRITRKTEPDLSDPVVQQRIDERLLEQHFSHLLRDQVEPRLESAVTST